MAPEPLKNPSKNPKKEPLSARRENLPFASEDFDTRRTNPTVEEFLKVFPRRGGEKEARNEWPNARRKASGETLIDAAIAYREMRDREPGTRAEVLRYTLMPAKWLREERWKDPIPNFAADDHRGGGVFAQAMALAAEMDEPEREIWE